MTAPDRPPEGSIPSATAPDAARTAGWLADGELAGLIREKDWSRTPLGPVDAWPRSLHIAVQICLRCRFPMVIFWGPELVQLYNDAYLQVLGAKHPTSLGQPAAVCWAEIWPVIGEMLAGVMDRGESTFDEDLRLDVRRYGTVEEAYFTFSYSPILIESGEVGGVFCAVAETTGSVIGARRLAALRDVGADAATARSAREVCEFAAAAMDAHRADLPYGMVYLAAGSRAGMVASWGLPTPVPPGYAQIELADPAAALPLGPAQATGTALIVERPQGLPPPAVAVLPACPSGDAGPPAFLVVGVSPVRELDGAYRSFLDVLAGQLTAAVAAAHAYESAQQRAQALAELDRAKTEFFSNISHEFRTPLTLITGPVAELRAASALTADARLREELEVIHRNGLRLGKLVNTLLEFSRIQAGRIQARYEPLDLGAVTAELASVFRSAIERAGLELEVYSADLGQPVFVDREMWEKVVLNLLSNALKFTFEGRINVAVRRSGDSAVMTVADTGTGIPAEELHRLFDRFHRIRGAQARSHEGSGIGLALVAELVALHGGSITADSTPGVGTTFTVTLPLGSAHLPADQLVPASTVTGASEGAAPFVAEALRWLPDAPDVPGESAGLRLAGAEALGPAGGRVLVADDNADMREYLHRVLAARYHVQAVPDGVAALHAAQAAAPDLIVADVMMPGMDGLELVAALRADPRTAQVPVLLLSARAGQEAAAEGLTAGADDYLVKPFTAGELLARVGAHLQLGQIRREAEQRLEMLQQAAAALSAAATPAEVAQAAVTHLALVLGASATTLYELREPGTLEQVTARGFAPEVARNWSTLPLSAPIALADAARRCRPVWLESPADCDPYPGMAALATRHGYPAQADLPLVIEKRCVGVLGALFERPRQFTQAERTAAVALADQCAQALHRAQLLATETTARVTAQRLNRLVGGLSAATDVAEVAKVILDYGRGLGATAAVVVEPAAHDQLTVLAARGYPEPTAPLATDAAHPLAHAVRTARPVWRGARSAEAWQQEAFDADGPLPVQVAVPLVVGDSAVGALGMRFADPAPTFTPEERSMILTLGGQCAQALDRARLYQTEHNVAQTLQRSLLPGRAPEFERLALAMRYLPGAPDVAAGGDWYDVLALDEHRVAIVVGDVVGQGAAAAAVMGQLRTALAAYLLDGHGPAAALERLDRLAARVPGALASTAAVVVLDMDSGQLSWARAGHPPPLLVRSDDVRYLTDGAGGPLSVSRRPPYREAVSRIEPGACLLLYTDGLIERRGQVIDQGMDHLAATAAGLCHQPPTILLDGLLAAALPDTGPADDVALIAARYLPAPLYQQLPADPAQLPRLRRAVRAWVDAGAVPPALGDDLQITVGEAAANAVEHAYAHTDQPGEFSYLLTHRSDGAIDVEVRDSGHWRTEPPANNAHRGRGLVVIRAIATDVTINTSPEGTQVRFRLSAPPAEPVSPAEPVPSGQTQTPVPAELQIHPQPDGGRRLELRGELDLIAATKLRRPLLNQLHAPGPVTLDLRTLDYLSSAGVGLLIQAAQHADAQGILLRLQLAPDSLIARLLTLVGFDTTRGDGTGQENATHRTGEPDTPDGEARHAGEGD